MQACLLWIFEKTQLSCALQPDRSKTALPSTDNQLILFHF